MAPKKIVLLGSTGSVGRNVLSVVSANPGRFEIVGLAAGLSAAELCKQAFSFGCSRIALATRCAADTAKAIAPGLEISVGESAMEEMAADPNADMVVCAIAGMAALKPVIAAIVAGKTVALASKEILVAAGHLIKARAKKSGAEIIPLDSEHNALFRLLAGHPPSSVEKLWITASGGPFYFAGNIDTAAIRPEEALAHPKWKMGPKVSVDSSTLMNKGFEKIEASRLFEVPAERVGILIHPQSAVHALVEFGDGSLVASLAAPDMRLPIQHALSWPDLNTASPISRLDLAKLGSLDFQAPDKNRFPCLALAEIAEKRGGLAPCAAVAADEVAVELFLAGKTRWIDIPEIVAAGIELSPNSLDTTLDDIFDTYSQIRESLLARYAGRTTASAANYDKDRHGDGNHRRAR